MAKLIEEQSPINYELMAKLSKARDHHGEFMSHLHDMKKHLLPEHHDEFNKHLMDMYNSFGRMKDLLNKSVSKVK